MIVTPDRIRNLSQQDRVLPYDEMGQVIRRLRSQDAPVFLTQGVFDIPHLGHAGYLQAARSIEPRNGIVVVGIESDESVLLNKGIGRPVNHADERASMLTEFRSTDLVFVYPGAPDYNNPEDFIERYRNIGPTAVVVPTWDPHLPLKERQAEQSGTTIATVIYRYENSTTRILRAIGYE
jgi:D-beta-D-heptose 7-phosphate kinase/D-beta-D-heptose 1-phosphate adenosyltransferase